MRRRALFCFAFSLVVASTTTLLKAQFQQPTPEELQMTADPKAPGAAAVYLYREETTDDLLHFHSMYERVKVLTEKGKELATVHVPYERGAFKVTNIEGRTIHADGTVIPLTTKPSDLMDFKTKTMQVNTMVFTLPSVEVGSILEYRLQIRYDDDMVSSPTWDIQQPYFVHKAHYLFVPSKSEYIIDSRGNSASRLMYWERTDGVAKVAPDPRGGKYTLDIADVPPTPKDDWMPPMNGLQWKVEFYYTPYTSGAEFWKNEGKRWAKEADRFAEPTRALKSAAEGMVAPTDSEEQKARKIYDEVMKLENTDFTREKSQVERKKENLKTIKNAEDVWNQKSGSADDLALLYVALARGAGLQAYPMQVVNRNRAVFDPTYLTLRQLDDYIAIVVIGGKEVFLDPGQKDCPFGMMHWKHTLATGLRIAASGPALGSTPALPYNKNLLTRVADLSLDPDGTVKGMVRYVMAGEEALYWRQIALKSDAEEVKKQFNEAMRQSIPDGVEADFDHFLALDDYNANLIGIVKVSGNMGAATGKRFLLPGLFFESRGGHPFAADAERKTNIDVHYARMEEDQVNLHLPAGFAVESLPQASPVAWQSAAQMKINAKQQDDEVEIDRVLAYNFTVLEAKAYKELHEFYQKVATADQQQLVLTRGPAAAAKGN